MDPWLLCVPCLRKLEIRLLVVLLAIVSGITIVATRPINRYFLDYAIVRYVDGGAESLRDEDEADDPGHTSEMMRYFGLALVLGASMTAGFRWACSQLLLTGRPKPSADATTFEHSGRDGGRAAPSAVVVEKAPSSSADAATADRDPAPLHARPRHLPVRQFDPCADRVVFGDGWDGSLH